MARVYSNVEMVVSRFNKTKNFNATYSKASLIEALKNVRFDLINVPLHSYRNVFMDENMRGTSVVGYIDGYDEETDTFNVVIHEMVADSICNYVDPVIYPRVKIQDGNVVKILGLDICPKLYYANMR